MRTLKIGLAALLAGTTLSPSLAAAPAPASTPASTATLARQARPNVVVILVDDLAWTDVSANRAGTIATPNIDSIGQAGATFSAGYVTASICSVSRAGLLSGRIPARFGFMYNITDRGDVNHGAGLPVTVPNLAERLRPLGYATAAFGKWHQGSTRPFYPTNRGFDEYFGFLAGESIYATPDSPGLVTTPTAFDKYKPETREGAQGLFEGPDMTPVDQPHAYLTETITEHAVDFLDRKAGGKDPFFLYVAYNAPHWPLQVPRVYFDRHSEIKDPARRTYVAMIEALDDGVGQILKTLEAKGVGKDTLIVFLSDNGCPVQFGYCTQTHPWGGGKFTYLEGGMRVPFMVVWPGHITPGQRVATPVSSLDIVPTVLDAAAPGTPLPDELDGVDLMRTLAGTAPKVRRFFWDQRPVQALREGRYKLWRSRDWKESKLYDIEADPWERTDLAARLPKEAARLEAEMDAFDATLPEPMWPLHSTRAIEVIGRKTEFVY
ncbi:sulfatase-like hydrolase/transferase [Novosphingobium sp. 1949]|uniref:Sulfatase-like hydrolase/transferase n=1 Tax=Novosphingobium organovorum TaxID=2930092 RepID=A0ABT0BH91_9SPHN|nr:sulfatase-like hydrolase/transferase [Novosphingobium organovorum]MCJ2184290.1 sulfatase-like hydrolase/transferase [Novosphingobium organovorum]